MTVTKQQQLEWLVAENKVWPFIGASAVRMSESDVGVSIPPGNQLGLGFAITREEWQQERDKMQNRIDIDPIGGKPFSVATEQIHPVNPETLERNIKAMNALGATLVTPRRPDNSWYERGELPPVGCECEVFVSDENKWMHFEVIAIRDGNVLGWCRESSCGFQSNDKSEFRPLRTEREKAIEEISTLVRDGLVSHEMAKEFAIKMHDAGLKLVKK